MPQRFFFVGRRSRPSPRDDDPPPLRLRRVAEVIKAHTELGHASEHLRRPGILPMRFSPFLQLDHSSLDAGRSFPASIPFLPPPRGTQSLVFAADASLSPGSLNHVTIYLDPGRGLHAHYFPVHVATPASHPTSSTPNGSARLITLADSLAPPHPATCTLTPASCATVHDLRILPGGRATLPPPATRVFLYIYCGSTTVQDGARVRAVGQGDLVVFEEAPVHESCAIDLWVLPGEDACHALVLCGEPLTAPASVAPAAGLVCGGAREMRAAAVHEFAAGGMPFCT
jgi:hypothetical protein